MVRKYFYQTQQLSLVVFVSLKRTLGLVLCQARHRQLSSPFEITVQERCLRSRWKELHVMKVNVLIQILIFAGDAAFKPCWPTVQVCLWYNMKYLFQLLQRWLKIWRVVFEKRLFAKISCKVHSCWFIMVFLTLKVSMSYSS